MIQITQTIEDLQGDVTAKVVLETGRPVTLSLEGSHWPGAMPTELHMTISLKDFNSLVEAYVIANGGDEIDDVRTDSTDKDPFPSRG